MTVWCQLTCCSDAGGIQALWRGGGGILCLRHSCKHTHVHHVDEASDTPCVGLLFANHAPQPRGRGSRSLSAMHQQYLCWLLPEPGPRLHMQNSSPSAALLAVVYCYCPHFDCDNTVTKVHAIQSRIHLNLQPCWRPACWAPARPGQPPAPAAQDPAPPAI